MKILHGMRGWYDRLPIHRKLVVLAVAAVPVALQTRAPCDGAIGTDAGPVRGGGLRQVFDQFFMLLRLFHLRPA